MKSYCTSVVTAALLAATAAPLAAKEEKGLTIDQLPAEVSKPILAAAGKAPLTLKKEKEDGVEAYEAKWEASGHKHEITVATSGAVLSEEEVIPVESAPEPVRAAIKAVGSELSGVEKATAKGSVTYEAAFKTADGKLEVKFDANGKELSREEAGKKKEHKHEEKEEEDGDED